MQDVARASGYSRAAVSLALRGDGTISEKTRRHIVATARRLGYQPNPLVSALMSLHRQRRPIVNITTVIAYLTSHPGDDPWRTRPFYVSMYDGAAERAAEMGCRLEEFRLRTAGMTPARMQDILRARNIHGIIVAPFPHGDIRIDFDFSSFAVVGLGMSVHAPVIERVANDHFQSVVLAVDQCVARGYRRIGLVLSQESSQRLDHRWLGGYRFAVAQHQLAAGPPPLMPARMDEIPAALPAWLRANRPDVVILGNSEYAVQAQLPSAVGMVALGVDRQDGALSGIHQNYALLGRVAAEHAMAKLYTNSFGLPNEAHLHLVAGTWVPGLTAPGPRLPRPSAAELKARWLVDY